MSLNITTNKKITDKTISDKFLSKFSFLGDKVFSNSKFGSSNNIDRFDFIKTKRLFPILNESLGIGNCGSKGVKVYEQNNAWFDCCNINEKGICFDGETFRDLTKEKEIKEEYKKSGWKHIKTENCVLHFERRINPIPNKTDIHAYFDTTSMRIEDAIIAKDALLTWFETLRSSNPYYEGNLYIIPLDSSLTTVPPDHDDLVKNMAERWLKHAYWSYNGTHYIEGGSWGSLAVLPAGFTGGTYVPPNDIIILSFIDECGAYSRDLPNSNHFCYHGLDLYGFGDGSLNEPYQPTIGYENDLALFLSTLGNYSNYFQVLYPIARFDGSVSEMSTQINVLQMIAAVEARLLTPLEISDLNASVDVSILETQNPYTIPLRDYNVKGIWDKTSPASEVFSSSTFGEELNVLLRIDQHIIQRTTAVLPVKKFSEPLFEIENMWSLIEVENKRCESCMPYDKIKNYLYNLAIK